MRDFRECDPAKGAERIAALTSRLTVLRDEPGGPLDILREFALALSLGDTFSWNVAGLSEQMIQLMNRYFAVVYLCHHLGGSC